MLSERLEMIKELSLTQCKCKEVKKRGHTFCTRCYGMLPQSLRDRLMGRDWWRAAKRWRRERRRR